MNNPTPPRAPELQAALDNGTALAAATKHINELNRRLDAQQEQVRTLRTALEFYADESNWNNEVTAGYGEEEFKAELSERTIFVGDRNQIDYAHGWEPARAALAQTSETKETA